MKLILTLLLHLLAAITLTTFVTATSHTAHQHPLLNPNPNSNTKMSSSSKSLNVFKKPLAIHSTNPMTGFLRNGYCDVPASDYGNHAVAAEVSEEFLDFTAQRGNDLRPVGLKGGCKWCLCVNRWREAFEAKGQYGDKIVPK